MNIAPGDIFKGKKNKHVHSFTEEDEVDRRSYEEDLKLQHASCEEIRKAVDTVAEMKAKNIDSSSSEREAVRVHGLLQFCALKKLNRLSHIRSKKAKDVTQAAKLTIDQHNLQLQNLLYEVMHLQKEIDKCLQFKSKDEDLNLVSLDDFYKEAPASIAKEEIKNDPHKERLARLDWELQQRRELAGKLKDVASELKNTTKEIDSKKQTVDNLLPQIETILQATQPVQEYLDIPLDSTKQQHETAQYLSRPLYVLYRQLTAYRHACDSSLSVTIDGDVDSAKALQSLPSDEERDESGESDQEENEKTSKRSRRTSENIRKQRKMEQVLRKHPLSVVIKIYGEGSKSNIELKFVYLVAMEIVAVNVTWQHSANQSSSITSSDLLNSSELLCCLYPGDDGFRSPNPANEFLHQKIGVEDVSQHFNELGYPYKWAQKLAGLQFLVDDGSFTTSTTPAVHTKQTLTRIQDRINNRLSMIKQFNYLEKGQLSVSPAYQHLFPSKISTHLVSWTRGVYEDFLVAPHCKRFADVGLLKPHSTYYTAVLQWKSVRTSVDIIIDVDYPTVAPIFIVNIQTKPNRTAVTDSYIRDLEAEVNIHHRELTVQSEGSKESHDQLLTNQLQRLAMCLDVYLESRNVSEKSKREESICNIKQRGPQRSIPFLFDSRRQLMTYR